jgi:tagaturonate reductase
MLMAMELNERSGDLLKSVLLKYGRSFGYGELFSNYVEACPLYNTLVDRIVPGYPVDAAERIFAKIGRIDKWLTCGELFHMFVLEGDDKILDVVPFDRAGLNVLITPDKLDFYHDRKVRILNGAHTSSVPVALLRGIENVDVFASDEECSKWLSGLMHEEICFALADSVETHAYAEEVLMRFRNPVLQHKFRTISLNSISKADARMSPTLRDYFVKKGTLPKRMMEAARKLCDLYGNGPVANPPGGPLELNDYAQIKGQSLADRIDCFFPSVPREMREVMLLEFE